MKEKEKKMEKVNLTEKEVKKEEKLKVNEEKKEKGR